MKKIILLSLSIMVGSLWMGLSSHNEVYAVSGCCKENTRGQWYNIGRNFEQCKAMNTREDINVFLKSGKYWWDIAC